jgi:glutamate synthase (NADPH/NADH) large chain
VLPFPVISNDDLAKLLHINRDGDMPGAGGHVVGDPVRPGRRRCGPGARIEEICAEVSEAIATVPGSSCSRTALHEWLAPIPSLLLTSAVHHHLVREKTRTQVGLLVEAGDAREVHHVALLIGYGAAAVNPYLAMESVEDLARGCHYEAPEQAVKQPTSRRWARACSR